MKWFSEAKSHLNQKVGVFAYRPIDSDKIYLRIDYRICVVISNLGHFGSKMCAITNRLNQDSASWIVARDTICLALVNPYTPAAMVCHYFVVFSMHIKIEQNDSAIKLA